MKGLRSAARLLVLAGGILVFTLLKQVLFPGLLEFALITAAHLLLAVGVGLLTVGLLRARGVAIVVGTAWALGWLLFHLGELIMLFFVLPPAWLSAVAVILILGGGLAAVVAFAVQERRRVGGGGGRGEGGGRFLSPAGLLVFAALSCAPLWVYLVVDQFPGSAMVAGHWLRVAADVAAALVILVTGVRLTRRSRR